MARFTRFAFLLAAFLPTAALAQSVEEFYRGRQITMLVAIRP